MLLKWIDCRVPTGRKDAFSEAQRAWHRLAGVSGFVAQAGGWDINEPSRACVFGLWSDEPAYLNFMRDVHDEVFQPSGQRSTYEKCDTALFDVVSEMPAEGPGFIDALESARLLRVAACYLHHGREEHFVNAQRGVWEPGMAEAPGYLGGLFSKRPETQAPHYLVTTAWRNANTHAAYVKNLLPALKKAANVKMDVERLEGSQIELEPSWIVRARARPSMMNGAEKPNAS